MGAISPLHVILVLIIALLVIGPGKLPETGAALGRAIREFRDAMEGKEAPAPPSPEASAERPSGGEPPPAGPTS